MKPKNLKSSSGVLLRIGKKKKEKRGRSNFPSVRSGRRRKKKGHENEDHKERVGLRTGSFTYFILGEKGEKGKRRSRRVAYGQLSIR